MNTPCITDHEAYLLANFKNLYTPMNITKYDLLSVVLSEVRLQAFKGTFNLRHVTPYWMECAHTLEEFNCAMIFTREEGYTFFKKWEDERYDRCLHLSLKFPLDLHPFHVTEAIVKNLFKNDVEKLWVERTEIKKTGMQVIHFRLWCNEQWKPMPEDEFHPLIWLELGWKPYSQYKQQLAKAA